MDCKDRFKKIERMLDNEHRENNNIRAELKAHKAQLDILSGAKWTEQPTPDPIEVGDTVRILDDKDFADRLKPAIGAEVEVINVIGGDLRIKMPSGVPQVIRKDQVALVRKDPNDPKNWKVGDWVECLQSHGRDQGALSNQFAEGEKYQIKSVYGQTVHLKYDDTGHGNAWGTQHFRPCSPPSPWDRATHAKFGDKQASTPYKITKQTEDWVNFNDDTYRYLKSNLTPLREVRTPGRKKGEFVKWSSKTIDGKQLGYLLEADEPDTVTYVECK